MKTIPMWATSAVALVLATGLNANCFAAPRWFPQVIDSDGDVGTYNSITVDTGDNIHISYYDVTNMDLRYAENTSGSWTVETIDSDGAVGEYSSIAIDSNGSVHISYHDSDNLDLKYVTNASGTWVFETVDSAGDVGKYTAIALDTSGMAHISYYDESNGDLKYARGKSGDWTVELVDRNDDAGEKSSIAVDTGGRVHISYSALVLPNYCDDYELRYALRTDNEWMVETVDTDAGAGKTNNLVLDSSENVYICYNFAGYHSGYRLVSNASGSWVVEKESSILTYACLWHGVLMALDRQDNLYVVFKGALGTDNCGDWNAESISSSGIGTSASFVVDSKRNVHFSSYDSDTGDLLYNTNESTPWQSEAIDCFDETGEHTDLVVDEWGNLHVSYEGSKGIYEGAPGVLNYATNISGVWSTETLDSDSFSIYRTALALDSNGNVHIVYDGAKYTGFVRYATNASGVWEVYQLPYGSSAVEIAMALDSNDNVHISYGENSLSSKNYVKYAYRASGSWNVETVFNGGYIPIQDTAIFIDTADNVHIAISNGNYLNYATNITGAWEDQQVDFIGGNGGSLSMVLESSGIVHISYIVKGLPGDPVYLSYAVGGPGAWIVWRLDYLGNMWHRGTSIALDAAGNPHISYYHDDVSADNLMYMTNAPGRWVREVVDTGGTVGVVSSRGVVGLDNAIGIDLHGKVHISYYDQNNTNLKYAVRSDSVHFYCIANFDGDGDVDDDDLSTFATNYGLNGVNTDTDSDSDSDMDGWDLFEMTLDYNRSDCLP